MMKHLLCGLLVCAAHLNAAPAWVSELNVKKPGPHLKIKPVQLSYALSWNGTVGAGRATFRFGQPDPRYPKNFIGQVFGGSTGFARKVFPFEFNYTSFLEARNYRPHIFVAQETDRDEQKSTTSRFTSKGAAATEKEKDLKSGKIKESTAVFSFPNTYCLHSALLNVRSLDLQPGQEAVFVVLPFKTPYLARVKHLGKEVHRTRRTIKYDLRLQKIDRDTLQLKHYDKLKSLHVWISDDAERLPLEIRSKVLIGDVRAVLDSKTYL